MSPPPAAYDAGNGPAPLLRVRRLGVCLPGQHGREAVLQDVCLQLHSGRTLGLVGESGSGKSITALAIMGLLPAAAQVHGSIQLHLPGRDNTQELLGMPERSMCTLRGNRIAMIFQEPMTALNPVHTIGNQVAEPLQLHQRMSRRDARQRASAMLERVGIAHAAQRMDAYPHEFSGGQRQRIMIAMALACGPALLIADEPTTALDMIVQQQILDLLDGLVAEQQMALLLISHDLGVVSEHCDEVAVMTAGRIVESGNTDAVLGNPQHPYTQQLLQSRGKLMAFCDAGHGAASER